MAAKVIAYTKKERLLLATLVDTHKLVEDKRKGAATVQMKQAEWENIATDYDSQGALISRLRTATQLKKLWNNLKQKKRKLNTQEKYQRLATRGGPPLEIVDNPVMNAVDVAAPCVDVNLSCPWDSTAIYMKDNKIQEPSEEIIHVYVGEDETKSEENFSKLKGDIFTPVHKGSRTPLNDKKTSIQNEANQRVRKLNDAIHQQAELHNIKMQVEQELLLKIQAEREEAEAKDELAKLQLKLFKSEYKFK